MNKTYGFIVALVTASQVVPAAAQDAWPARPVRLIVPSSPGGGTDTYARLLAQGLGEALKRQFIIDNRPGASGNVGAEIAAKAAPDGHTFLVSAAPALVINPSLYRKLPYDAERDFVPVARGVVSPNALTCHPSLPAKTLPGLIALGKREPGTLPYGSPGAGSTSNFTVKVLEEASGARFMHVPYKGAGQAVQGLLRGETAFQVSEINAVQPHIQAGKVRVLAVSHRIPQVPSAPTYAEAGYPNVDTYPSFSVAAPAGTPPAIVQRLSTEIVKLMRSPMFREKLDARAMIPIFDTPEEFAATLKKERARYAEIIRRNNIVVE